MLIRTPKYNSWVKQSRSYCLEDLSLPYSPALNWLGWFLLVPNLILSWFYEAKELSRKSCYIREFKYQRVQTPLNFSDKHRACSSLYLNCFLNQFSYSVHRTHFATGSVFCNVQETWAIILQVPKWPLHHTLPVHITINALRTMETFLLLLPYSVILLRLKSEFFHNFSSFILSINREENKQLFLSLYQEKNIG